MKSGKRVSRVAGVLRRFGNVVSFILKPVYKIYEAWLFSQIYLGPMPRHVAIIPDGNRRWARSLGLRPVLGHNVGYKRLKEVLGWLWDLDIKVVTLYAMSYENCVKRSREEKENIFKLISSGIDELLQGEIDKRRVRIKFFGRFELLPDELVAKIRKIEEYSSKYSDRYLNIAICYGGRQEIIDAVRRLAADVKRGLVKPEEIDDEVFKKYLYTSHLSDDGLEEPDLVIRTSGELRISNFLLWQIAYSELYFCDVYWPEFRRIDLWRAIRSYQRRERRFGK